MTAAEKTVGAWFSVDAELAVDLTAAAVSDDLGATIDYGAVVERLRESLSNTHFILLERLCEHVADVLQDDFKSPWVRVSATKIGAIRGVKRVGVTIERGTKD